VGPVTDEPEFVQYEKLGQLVTITLNRPEKLNAITRPFSNQMVDAFRRFAADPDARLLLLRGAGRSFCAGRDINAWAEPGQSQTDGLHSDLGPYVIPPTDKPVITSCRGHAIGVGGYLAMAGDVRIVSETFKFGLREVPTGVLGPYWIGATENVPRTVAFRLAMGDDFSLEELKHWGIVTEVVPDHDLEAATQRWVERLLALPYQHVLETKRLMSQFSFQYTPETWAYEYHVVRPRLNALADTREAARAFAEKRPPKFIGA
jgi:enoyl-CoA hydratase/carnithine racemase